MPRTWGTRSHPLLQLGKLSQFEKWPGTQLGVCSVPSPLTRRLYRLQSTVRAS